MPRLRVCLSLSRSLRLLSCCCARVIRDRLDLGLIHRLRAFAREGRAGGSHPELTRLSAGTAGAGFDAVGIDSELALAAGEISLGIEGTFRRQVFAFLGGLGVAYDHQLVVRGLLQDRKSV